MLLQVMLDEAINKLSCYFFKNKYWDMIYNVSVSSVLHTMKPFVILVFLSSVLFELHLTSGYQITLVKLFLNLIV